MGCRKYFFILTSVTSWLLAIIRANTKSYNVQSVIKSNLELAIYWDTTIPVKHTRKRFVYIWVVILCTHLLNNFKIKLIFFFSFAYTTSPAVVMKLVVFFRSSKPPYNFWWSGVVDGHCAIRSGWCLWHLWRKCSVVWSSSPQGHVGEGTIFNFLCMCALSLLWPERSRAKTTWPDLSRRWYASLSFLGFSAVLMMVVFSW